MTHHTTSAGLPASIHIVAPAYPAFAQAAVHIRAGMIFHPDRPVELFENGNASFYLVQGNPGQSAIDLAKESTEHALAMQAMEFEAAVKHEAAILVERQAREKLEKQIAAEVQEHKRKIAEIEKQAAEAIAKLNK